MKKLRHNIRLLGMLVASLFLGLVVYFSYSVYFYGGRWFANAYNPRLYDQKQQIIAGDILDRTGTVLATTTAEGRSYPQDSAARRAVSHVVGDSGGIVANGAETFMASYLLGYNAGVIERVQQLFSSDTPRGDDVRLSVDQALCVYAADQINGYEGGAVVVLNYRTGELLCMTSYPDFDPRYINETLYSETDNGAFVNRATQGLYPPGSTFKIVTLASTLENIPEAVDQEYHCVGTLLVDQTTITEASNQVHGEVNLKQAFAYSCNTRFASLSLELGYSRLARTASSFGFGDNFLFRDLVVENSQYPATGSNRDEQAWSGVGQGRVLTTPLHMALIAGAVANDGVIMEPRLMLAATSPQGTARSVTPMRTYKRAMTAEVAAVIKEYMIACVNGGTGTRARVDGYTVAGKTGSAEVSDDKSIPTHAWFVGFIDNQEHPLAIAVLVEQGGSGGTVAASIAGRVLQKALQLGY